MRVTTAFKRLLRLDGVNVTNVEFAATVVRVTITLRRRRLVCGRCGYKTSARYDTRPVASTWRHLDLGVWQVELRAMLRRLGCPTHGVVIEGVPFARPGAKLTRDFDDLVAWLATRMDKTAISRLCRVSWRTVGRACERVVTSELDPGRLDGLFRIGVDEISWRKHHKYLTLVVDHDRGVVVWGHKVNPEDLTTNQAAQLARIRRNRGGIWRAYEMKEQFRAIFAGDLTRDEAAERLDRWCARAQRSRLAPFIKAARTMRHRRDLILNAIEHGISNGRVEGLNNKVRLIVRRGYGFHSAEAALALVMLAAGPITLNLPHERPPAQAAA